MKEDTTHIVTMPVIVIVLMVVVVMTMRVGVMLGNVRIVRKVVRGCHGALEAYRAQ